MQIKKNTKFDLENKKGIFFSIGLILSLSLALYALEFSSTKIVYNIDDTYGIIDIEDDFIQPTKIKEKLKKPVHIPDIILKTDDNAILVEIEFSDTEIGEDDAIEIEDIVEPLEEVETIKFQLVESLPKFKKT